MAAVVLADAGPLIALFDPRDTNHVWAVATLQGLREPLLTCDAVITETTYQLGYGTPRFMSFVDAIERGLVVSSFELTPEIKPLRRLVARFASVPMSFADACLVRMSELRGDAVVWTTDSDFEVYRRHGRQVIPTLMPR